MRVCPDGARTSIRQEETETEREKTEREKTDREKTERGKTEREGEREGGGDGEAVRAGI